MKIKNLLYRDGFFLGYETVELPDKIKIRARHTKNGVILKRKDLVLIKALIKANALDEMMPVLDRISERIEKMALNIKPAQELKRKEYISREHTI